MKKVVFALFFCFISVFAQEPIVESSSSFVEENFVAEETMSSSSEEPVSSSQEGISSSSSKEEYSSSSQRETALEMSSESKGGLLDALYPVAPDEAIAKGRFLGGTTLSLIQGNTDDDALNILFGDIYEGYGYMFTVEAFGGYFIKDAMALGLRGGYSRTWLDIDFALMEDLLDVAEHRKYVSNGFFVQPFLKNYLKVFDSRNFYFFNETSISVEYSYGISQADDGEDMNKSRTKGWSIDVGINPGICIMVLNRFAFETSVGLLGLSSSVMEVEENGETHSEFLYNIVNFTINLLALDFSLVYFF